MMIRFILFIAFILILYYVLHILIRDMPRLRRRNKGEPGTEELVRDPHCQVYLPKSSAIKRKVAGKDYYFCKPECFQRFLDGEKP